MPCGSPDGAKTWCFLKNTVLCSLIIASCSKDVPNRTQRDWLDDAANFPFFVARPDWRESPFCGSASYAILSPTTWKRDSFGYSVMSKTGDFAILDLFNAKQRKYHPTRLLGNCSITKVDDTDRASLLYRMDSFEFRNCSDESSI